MQARPRIRLATFGCVSIVIVFILMQSNSKTDVIDWAPYSVSEIHNDLDKGKVVLISAMASWSHGTLWHEHIYSHDPVILDLIDANPIACYQLDLAKIPNEQITAWRNGFGDVSGLGLLLLKKNTRNEVIMRRLTYDEISVEKVIFEIELLNKPDVYLPKQELPADWQSFLCSHQTDE